jgi:hypothetical protein
MNGKGKSTWAPLLTSLDASMKSFLHTIDILSEREKKEINKIK